MVDPEFIPSTPLDLTVLREKFEAAVRRHLLAEVGNVIHAYLPMQALVPTLYKVETFPPFSETAFEKQKISLYTKTSV